MSVRVRFAPSPTGALHLGNARTAVLNWLLARQSGGQLVLRIEDTDTARNVAGSEESILADLGWLGVDWDEGPEVGGAHGPYRQSQRGELYRGALARLLESGRAYEDDAAVRFRVPARDVRFTDRLRGDTGVAAGEIEDFVVGRSDGSATYQLAVVVDDHAMQITDVVRGQDHLTNTPRQLLLYEALGWEPPRFAHLPLVLGPDRTRLSKRHGATSVGALRDAGILPEALLNYLVLLGWGPPDDQEVLGANELLESWRLEATSAANAIFDVDKLGWLGQQHLGRVEPGELALRLRPFLARTGVDSEVDVSWLTRAVELLRPASHDMGELAEQLQATFWAQAGVGDASPDAPTREALEAFAAASEQGRLLDPAAFRPLAGEVSAATGLRGRALFHPLRVAVTGRDAGPDLSRLLPLIDSGARAGIEPAVLDVASRIRAALR